MDIEFLSFQGIDYKQFIEFVLRFVFDFIIIYNVAKIYYRVRQKRDILFTLFLLNIIVFIVCYLLQSIQLSLGFAFGIFAIFSILRYRTSQVPIKEMTYIFISISLAIINALTDINTGYGIVLFSNIVIIIAIFYFEKRFAHFEKSKTIIYDNLLLIKPDKYDELKLDLEDKTGLSINRLEIGRIDLQANNTTIKIHY